ncbi:PQQ-dependent dehydrogenase, methanol/ethanol family [Bacteroidota bacterium]
MKLQSNFILFVLPILLLGCEKTYQPGTPEHITHITSRINDDVLAKADEVPGDWMSHGKNYYEDRFSPLDQISKTNIDSLGLAWSLTLGTKRGIEATPLVVDGIMFLTGPWSIVYAVDARTGEKLWTYYPQVPGKYGEKACCDVVNRGLAMYRGQVYVGTLDGRLISLDAATGEPIWEVLTVDTTKNYTITGAPRVVDGKVVIGNGGAEYGVRGYVTAYDAMTGEQAWRFYIVPGDPSLPFESHAMEVAAKTWNGEWWKHGGGGTAWDAMAYDPELRLLYVGTGNGSPWARQYRSPGGGDNLYLSSIVALNPDNGELVWYYQTTPGESWDFTATQHIILADLEIEGQQRKVLMQAPKNGFFYVLDRATGELLSADAFVYVNWATGVDLKTGRPMENIFTRYEIVNAMVAPNYEGGHNWHPMAYNPLTGLVYIPALDNASMYGINPNWHLHDKGFGVGNKWNVGIGHNPEVPVWRDSLIERSFSRGKLMAWDPVEKRQVWKVDHPTTWNPGILTTGPGLVFQGTSDGRFVAYDATDGSKLWESDLDIGVLASPVTYLVDGVQYISIAAGWGSGMGHKVKYTEYIHPGTIFTYVLGGNAPDPEFAIPEPKKLIDLAVSVTEEEIVYGRELFTTYCALCHASVGSGWGVIPDLGYSVEGIFDTFHSIVLEGQLLPLGMPSFGDRLSEQEVTTIKNYILGTAHKKIEEQNRVVRSTQ